MAQLFPHPITGNLVNDSDFSKIIVQVDTSNQKYFIYKADGVVLREGVLGNSTDSLSWVLGTNESTSDLVNKSSLEWTQVETISMQRIHTVLYPLNSSEYVAPSNKGHSFRFNIQTLEYLDSEGVSRTATQTGDLYVTTFGSLKKFGNNVKFSTRDTSVYLNMVQDPFDSAQIVDNSDSSKKRLELNPNTLTWTLWSAAGILADSHEYSGKAVLDGTHWVLPFGDKIKVSDNVLEISPFSPYYNIFLVDTANLSIVEDYVQDGYGFEFYRNYGHISQNGIFISEGFNSDTGAWHLRGAYTLIINGDSVSFDDATVPPTPVPVPVDHDPNISSDIAFKDALGNVVRLSKITKITADDSIQIITKPDGSVHFSARDLKDATLGGHTTAEYLTVTKNMEFDIQKSNRNIPTFASVADVPVNYPVGEPFFLAPVSNATIVERRAVKRNKK